MGETYYVLRVSSKPQLIQCSGFGENLGFKVREHMLDKGLGIIGFGFRRFNRLGKHGMSLQFWWFFKTSGSFLEGWCPIRQGHENKA